MLAAAAGFAALLGVAAWRKWRDLGAFEAVIGDYRLLPASLLRPTAVVVPVVEGALALAWLAAPWWPDVATFVAVATTALLLGYGGAIAANLRRGRSWIDCGCGGGEQLSWALVARNAVLALFALGALVVVDASGPGWADLAVSIPVLAVGTGLYLAASTLLDNAAALADLAEAGP